MKKHLLIIIFGSIVISGCEKLGGSPTDATKENFAKVLSDYYSQKDCIAVSPFGMGVFKEPVAIEMTNKLELGQYDALEAAGILKSESTEIEKQDFFTKKKVTAKKYNLTDQGEKIIRRNGNGLSARADFCIGNYKLINVINFSEPSPAMGLTISKVNYSLSPENVPVWATTPEFQKAFPAIKRELEENQEKHMDLVLMSDGWAVTKGMRK